MEKDSGVIFSIEEFAVNDGPGIRTTVFLKGCPLRCAWCHNPEGWSPHPQPLTKQGRTEICGYSISVDKLVAMLRRDEDIFRESGGGVTFTGGEPLVQADFLCNVLDRLSGIHRAVETSGHAPGKVFERVLEKVELMLFDVKLVDGEMHKKYTERAKELTEEYEECFGPLTHESGSGLVWIKNPWPWEYMECDC